MHAPPPRPNRRASLKIDLNGSTQAASSECNRPPPPYMYSYCVVCVCVFMINDDLKLIKTNSLWPGRADNLRARVPAI